MTQRVLRERDAEAIRALTGAVLGRGIALKEAPLNTGRMQPRPPSSLLRLFQRMYSCFTSVPGIHSHVPLQAPIRRTSDRILAAPKGRMRQEKVAKVRYIAFSRIPNKPYSARLQPIAWNDTCPHAGRPRSAGKKMMQYSGDCGQESLPATHQPGPNIRLMVATGPVATLPSHINRVLQSRTEQISLTTQHCSPHLFNALSFAASRRDAVFNDTSIVNLSGPCTTTAHRPATEALALQSMPPACSQD